MQHTMRWFGPRDPVSLMDIRQAGCSGVVTALHHIPVGDIWSVDEIETRKQMIAAPDHRHTPLSWSVTESLPVHESIKKATKDRDRLIDNYIRSLKNLAKSGIRTVCYNFMPVLDWSRTDVNYPLPDGSRTLRYVREDFALFDLYILRRPGAEKDYTPDVVQTAHQKWKSASRHELEILTDTVLLGLPGSEEKFELSGFQRLLDEYRDIGAAGLQENLHFFLKKTGPVASELGLNLAIHPDDPPYPLLGLPRVVSTADHLSSIFEAYSERANGLTFCTGSLGVRADNNLSEIAKNFADRIHFIHLRSTFRESDDQLTFHEAPHLEGDVDMYRIVRIIKEEEARRLKEGEINSAIPMRPDHGFQMLDDLHKNTYPGYSAIGRLKGLAELRGLEFAIEKELLIYPN